MTGNLVVGALAIGIGGQRSSSNIEEPTGFADSASWMSSFLQPPYAYYSIIGAFLMGAFVSTFVELKLRQRGIDPFWGMLTLLTISDIGGCLAVTLALQDRVFVLFFAFFGFSAGTQYEYISSKPFGLLTTLQTGNIQRAARGMARVLLRHSSDSEEEKELQSIENFRILQTIVNPLSLAVGTLVFGVTMRYTNSDSSDVMILLSVWVILVLKMVSHVAQHFLLPSKDLHETL